DEQPGSGVALWCFVPGVDPFGEAGGTVTGVHRHLANEYVRQGVNQPIAWPRKSRVGVDDLGGLGEPAGEVPPVRPAVSVPQWRRLDLAFPLGDGVEIELEKD